MNDESSQAFKSTSYKLKSEVGNPLTTPQCDPYCIQSLVTCSGAYCPPCNYLTATE